jgi:hypothetical protein
MTVAVDEAAEDIVAKAEVVLEEKCHQFPRCYLAARKREGYCQSRTFLSCRQHEHLRMD